MNPTKPGSLFLVSTPIGNLKDITLRALEILSQVDLILAEDTRHAGKLLSHYEIKTPKTSYHDYTKSDKIESLINQLENGKTLALLSDSGTPLLSDPGYALVKAAVKRDITVIPLPGASALLSALVPSGATMDSFVYEGFIPVKGSSRNARLNRIAKEERTQILYESPYKIVKLLKDLKAVLGENREIVLARELTKLHEEFLRGTADDLIKHFEQKKPKGEFVVVVPRALDEKGDSND